MIFDCFLGVSKFPQGKFLDMAPCLSLFCGTYFSVSYSNCPDWKGRYGPEGVPSWRDAERARLVHPTTREKPLPEKNTYKTEANDERKNITRQETITREEPITREQIHTREKHITRDKNIARFCSGFFWKLWIPCLQRFQHAFRIFGHCGFLLQGEGLPRPPDLPTIRYKNIKDRGIHGANMFSKQIIIVFLKIAEKKTESVKTSASRFLFFACCCPILIIVFTIKGFVSCYLVFPSAVEECPARPAPLCKKMWSTPQKACWMESVYHSEVSKEALSKNMRNARTNNENKKHVFLHGVASRHHGKIQLPHKHFSIT